MNYSPRPARDRGYSLVELLVVIILIGAVAAVSAAFFTNASRNTAENQQRVGISTTIDDANLRIGQDVEQATSMRVAEAQRLVLTVVRDGHCQVVDWHVDTAAQALSTTTETYEGKTCSGASTTGTKAVLRRYTQTSTFSYWGESSTYPLSPVDDTREVKRVAWELAAAPYEKVAAPPITMASSAVYTGRGQHDGTGTQAVQAKAPLLSVVTPREGVDQPVLTWVDPTPAVTKSWVVARSTGPEDGKDQPYQPVAWLDKATTTWTDSGLQPGYRGTYLVLAWLTDGSQGPSSNVVDTGLRPARVQGLVATGQPTAIRLDWTAATGAQGYDVYRDGALVKNLGKVTSYTDALTYGHSHTYQVVAVNTWEGIATTGDPHVRVASGHQVGDALRGATRLASTAAGAFTAPAAPSATATPTPTSSGAVYQTTVTWGAAAWVGAGPTAGRDVNWDAQFANDAGVGSFTDLWVGVSPSTPTQVHTGRTPGATDRYQLRTCNAIGCSPWSSAAASLQRPPAPSSCSIPAVSTRGQQVVVNAAPAPSAPTSYTLAHTSGDGVATGTGTQAGATFNIDGLVHGQWHSYSGYASNGSGDSPAVGCSAATQTLTVAAATCTVSSIDTIAPGGFVVSGGDQVKLGSSGTAYSGPRSYGSLSAGTYRGYAQNTASDGYNSVTSGWDACSSVTIVDPYPTAWAGSAPGCPSLGVAIPYGSPATWQVRRSSGTRCEARWVVTKAGADNMTTFEGDVLATGSYTLGSGATAYSGSADYKWGPLIW